MSHDAWELGYHLRSPKSWLNDPNGLCQFGGTYRFFYQYNPVWPHEDQKAWGQFSSKDLVHWRYEGVSIEPSLPQDRNGVYSGCSVVQRGAGPDGQDVLRAYYTGNVVDPGPNHNPLDVGFAHDGREANQLTCVSVDGVHFGPKTVLLRNEDYPDWCSLHVRDPKVWTQDGVYYMLLGARDAHDVGLCLLYESDDGLAWSYRNSIRSEYPFGYMWECPNIVQLDGADYLAFSPQGLPRTRDFWHNLWNAGYVALQDGILDTRLVDERDFVEWDHGHDFYAPQTFCDDAGRWMLVGWLGGFDPNYTSVPDGLEWCHCLTVPRLLVRDDATGLLCQTPVPELEVLRCDARQLGHGTRQKVPGRCADVVLCEVVGEGALTFDDSLQVFFQGGRLGLRYLDGRSGAGRQERSIPCNGLRDLRVLIDGSAVEVYANGGSEVFSSRWFCSNASSLCVTSSFVAGHVTVWRMAGAGMN